MSGYNAKVYHEQGGDRLVVSAGGSLVIEAGAEMGFFGAAPVDQPAALTTQLTTLSGPAVTPGTPDYAIQDVVNSNAYGFVTADEARTVLSVIVNLQTRVAELEARLEELGLVAGN